MEHTGAGAGASDHPQSPHRESGSSGVHMGLMPMDGKPSFLFHLLFCGSVYFKENSSKNAGTGLVTVFLFSSLKPWNMLIFTASPLKMSY